MLKTFKKKTEDKKIKDVNIDSTIKEEEVPKRKIKPKKSIYTIILNNVNNNGILNVPRIEEELWKLKNNPAEPRIMAGFIDNLRMEPKEVNHITGMLVLDKLAKVKYQEMEEFEEEFKRLGVNAKEFLNFFHKNMSILKPDMKLLHDFMVKVFTQTKEMEVFKTAFEIVGMFTDESTEQMIFTIGQYPELTRYMGLILLNRGNFSKITELAARTEGWGKVSILELLIFNNLIKGNIDEQIGIIRAVYSGNFVLNIETDPLIAYNFDIKEILEKSINNKELFLNLVYIMNTSIEGGSYRSLVGTPDGIEKIEKFIQTLRKVSFEKEKLVGFIILYRMLKYIPKEVLESSFKEEKYSELKTETDEYLKKNYTAKNMEEILETENEFFLLDYAIDNKKKFMIDLLRKKYLSNIYNYNFLNLIFEIGSDDDKNEIFRAFKNDFKIEKRKQMEYSVVTKPEWTLEEEFRHDVAYSIIIANLNKINNDEINNYIEYCVHDFNPQIRHTALIAMLTAENFQMTSEISEQVKKLLAETPPVRKTAAEVMKKYEIKFSATECKKVVESLGEKLLDGEKEALEKLVRK